MSSSPFMNLNHAVKYDDHPINHPKLRCPI